MKKLVKMGVVAALMAASSANAAVVVTSTPATNPYTGPAPTYDFETPAPVTGGSIVNNSVPGQHTRPFGSTGNYLSAGPIDGSPAVLDLSAFSRIGSITLLWGSTDQFNTLELLDSSNNVIFSILGSSPLVRDLSAAQPGNVNRVVTFTFSDLATQTAVKAMRFSSSLNAFEVDNVSVRAVPEPSTWLLMILGMLGIGFAMRRRPAEEGQRIRFA